MDKVLKVIAVHGEGDRGVVNALQNHRNKEEAKRLASYNMPIPPHLARDADEPPDIVVLLRDEDHKFRIEWPVQTWKEVERWKTIAGFDAEKRHWQVGANVLVTIGD